MANPGAHAGSRKEKLGAPELLMSSQWPSAGVWEGFLGAFGPEEGCAKPTNTGACL